MAHGSHQLATGDAMVLPPASRRDGAGRTGRRAFHLGGWTQATMTRNNRGIARVDGGTEPEPIEIGDWSRIEPSLVTIQTQHVSAEVDVDLGTQVIQENDLIGLSVGTTDESAKNINMFSGLTPAQARELALELQEAAAAAEAAPDDESLSDSSADESTMGRLRQLLG